MASAPEPGLGARAAVGTLVAQAWFWTDAWQTRESQADKDIDAGRTTTYPDAESFLADLPT